MPAVSSQDTWSHVSEIIRLVRSGSATTRPDLARVTRLSRTTVTHRVQTAQDLGLLEPSGEMRSHGGRAAEVWRFRGDAGRLLVGLVGTRAFTVALTDLDGTPLARRDHAWNVQEGPEASVRLMAGAMRALLADQGVERPWGIGVGLPAPIDVTTGRSVDPVAPTTATYRWPREFDVRGWFLREFATPTWTESVIHLATLGATAAPDAPDDLVYVRVGTGLGAGLVAGGRLQRGASWVAGELNHVTVSDDPGRLCLCGRVGCLETYASGWAMLAEAERAVDAGSSPHLARAAATGEVSVDDIGEGVEVGDAACVEIVARAADHLGRALATLVTLVNPARVIVGGFALARSPLFVGALERSLRTHALPASVAGLEVALGAPDGSDGVTGASLFVSQALLSSQGLSAWGFAGSPVGVGALLGGDRQIVP